LVYSAYLSAQTRGQVYLKLENIQETLIAKLARRIDRKALHVQTNGKRCDQHLIPGERT